MITFFKVIFWISLFTIFWANLGYPISVLLLDKILNRENKKDKTNYPTATIMVVAHNEEDVIENKLQNLKEISYPKNKIKFLVSSDNSTDNTNEIVRKFIKQNPDMDLTLYEVKNRAGKTNAQNEAQKIVDTEILVMTDANSMIDPNAIKELVSSFSSDDISYVAGKLKYINEDSSETSENESFYWQLDLKIREIESNIQTITAGNGALYAVRNDRYYDFDPIKSHDSSMPILYALREERAIANHDALVFEKAGETTGDEYKRKVRMNRVMLSHILPDVRMLNVFKYKWFTYFYLGHRTSRYLLWISHLLLLISNIVLAFESRLFLIILIPHLLFWTLAIVKKVSGINNKILNIIYYYAVTIIAQWHGVFNVLTGRAKPFWEKAESTR